MVFSALTIAGSDSGGGAGVQSDLRTFAAHRVHGLSVITSLTAQNTQDVKAVEDVSLKFIETQFDAVHEDFNVGAAKTGMLSNKKIIRTVSDKLGSYPLVVDPVMVSESGGRLLAEDAVESLQKRIFSKALIVTPNLYEAQILAAMKIESLDDMRRACKRISDDGCSVVIKGGHLNAKDLLYHEGVFHTLTSEKLKGSFHGSGCTFAAAIASNLSLGFDLVSSVFNAKNFIVEALKTAYAPGRGEIRAVNQARISYEENSDDILRALRKAVVEIEALPDFKKFIPEVGLNVCYAKKGAKSAKDVAGLSGRIIRVGSYARSLGPVVYGGSKHVAGIVLSAMKHDPTIRSALNIRYRPEFIAALESLEAFNISSFSRDDEPGTTSTMEWGTEEAIRKSGRVPDIIFDKGGAGKEPMIRILGRDPLEVLAKLRVLVGALHGV